MNKNPFENILPRLIPIKSAASLWGVHPNTYRKLYKNGTAPGPVDVGVGRLLFDYEQQIRAIARLSGSTEVADLANDL
jgi:hypothetical protein